MLPDAELFVMAEKMLVEVLGRISDTDTDIVLPPLFDLPGDGHSITIWRAVEVFVVDDANVPDLLAGREIDSAAGEKAAELLGHHPHDGIARVAEAAIAAAGEVSDPDAVVHATYGEVSARDYLRRLTLTRSFLAHYVAAHLGSTACPLPEELARPLWELTEPDAASWRALGMFHDPLPLPDNVSWRDRFLLRAGHQPHPLGH